MPTILVTGFGPFPGAPFNPTGPLVEQMARTRRPALAEVKIVAHVFPTSYAAVDRDLPRLVAKYKPNALLMFGLAPRAKTIRIETRARNTAALLSDAGGAAHAVKIAPGGPSALLLPAPAAQLLAAARTARVPVMQSHDAGRYLCNYLCWRASEAVRRKNGPRLAAFVHVPMVARFARRPGKRPAMTLAGLCRAGAALLVAAASVRHV
jgi:pyroglutamyl-peptidase